MTTFHDLLVNSPMPVRWTKDEQDRWCELRALHLNHAYFDYLEGVYIIWHAGAEPAVVKVGQGNLREAFHAARRDPAVQFYAPLTLLVTWTTIAPRYRAGAQAFLAEHYRPKRGGYLPGVTPMPIELPEASG